MLDSTPHRLNSTRSVRIDPDADAPIETPVVVEDDGDGIDYASQAHILKVLELMGCKDEHEHSVRRLPHIDIRYQVECANEISAGSMQRIENVFLKGIKAWICLLLPNLRLKCDEDMKMSFSIQSTVAAMGSTLSSRLKTMHNLSVSHWTSSPLFPQPSGMC